MLSRGLVFLWLALAFAPASLHATVYLLLDDRLKKTPIEQVIYKFVPLTSATEVELSYLHDFLAQNRAAEYLKKIKKGDHALYLSADAWPAPSLQSFFASAKLNDFAGKIDFLAAPGGGEGTPSRPQLLLSHHDLWRRFAELTGARYAGFFEKHYLDANIEPLAKSSWSNYSCVHSTGRTFSAGRASPISAGGEGFRLNFKVESQLVFLGRLVCINTPKADTFFELSTYKGDVELVAEPGRFSAWNEAQPLRLRVTSTRQVSAPLLLEIIPEVNREQTEFFFQGDRISCQDRKCIKKAARFLMPAMTELSQNFELAIRASGDSYFRGQLKLRSGEIEVARTEFRFLPASWLVEFSFALRHPSEYKTFFLHLLLVAILAILCIAGLVVLLRKATAWVEARQKPAMPRQTSAGVRIDPEKNYRLTASQNPFGCELAYFGGIIDLKISGEKVLLKNGDRGQEVYDVKNFRVRLADGYVLKLKRPGDSEFFLEAYLAP